jgi:DMSO/TMAO reductase YedYZ heme-binding membrane subunit
MIVAAFLIVLTLLALFSSRFIRKHNTVIYLVAILFSIFAFVTKDNIVAIPFMKGFLGLSFFYIVMVTGALPKKSKIKKSYMSLRREYSILGFIVITPHALNYIVQWINGTRSIEWFGFIAFVIMIPLFITSFVKIRKKMKPKNWKRLQSLAYIIYILLFIHLILNYSKSINLVLYLIIFITYFVLKIYTEIIKYKSKKKI